MGATSDISVDEAKASLQRAEEAKAKLTTMPQQVSLEGAIDMLRDLGDTYGELPATVIIVNDDGEPVAAMVPASVAQGAGWCAPSL